MTSRLYEIDDLRDQLEKARADVQWGHAETNRLEEAHAQLAAARVEAERGMTARLYEIDDLRGQLEAAQAERHRAHTEASRVEEAHSQLEAAHVETEQAVAARLGEIEDLRSQLEAARADVQQRVQAETTRVEAAAQTRLQVARAEFQTQIDLERASRTMLMEALDEARIEVNAARALAQRHIEAAHKSQAEALAYVRKGAPADTRAERAEIGSEQPAAKPSGARLPNEKRDQPSTGVRPPDVATNLPQVLDALVDGLGAVFPRAALFVVKSRSRLQGWRSVGFTGAAAITNQFELSLTIDSALTRAVNTGRVIITGENRPPDQDPVAGAGEAWSVTLPVAMGDRVVAVVHADAGERAEAAPASFDRGAALKVSDTLIRDASRRLSALTASAELAFGELMGDVRPTATAPDARAASAKPAPQEDHQLSVDDARRYARLLASEIKRYNDANILAGLPDHNLHERLKGEIARCRSLYTRRVPPEAAEASNCFDEALFEMLGGGVPAPNGSATAEQEVSLRM
jgi:hypothetical protein